MTNEERPKLSIRDAVCKFNEIADSGETHPIRQRKPLQGERLHFDLRDIEQTYDADLTILVTEESDQPKGMDFPSGIVIDANRRAHGADLHLAWDQTKQLRDVLTRILREAGQE